MQRLVKYADELVTGVGPRPGGSKGEHEAAELIAANLEGLGLDTWIQEFSTARSIGWVRVLYYLLGVVAAMLLFFMPEMATLAFILALIAGGLLALDLLGKNPLYNLFNKGLSQNVVARYVPEGADPRRKVVVVAHYDSGRSMLQCAPPLARFYIVLRTCIRTCIAVLLLVTLLSLFPLPEMLALVLSVVGLISGILLLIAMLVEVINLFMPYNQGANCNASGVAAMMGVAETLVGVRGDGGVDSGGIEPRRRGAHAHESASSRSRSSRGGASAGIGGAVGSIFSKARGLMGKKTPEQPERARRDEVDYDDYVDPVEKTRIRSGVPVSRGVAPSAAAERSSAYDNAPQASETGFDAGTADLGAAAAAAAQAAADNAPSSQERTQRGGTSGAKYPARSRIAAGATDNPAIRVRAPLAEQQERDRAFQAEAEATASAEREKDSGGVPEWFVNAKKAANKETDKNADTEKETKVVRSRYADVPVEYKPEAEQEPQPAERPETEQRNALTAQQRQRQQARSQQAGGASEAAVVAGVAAGVAAGIAAGVAVSSVYDNEQREGDITNLAPQAQAAGADSVRMQPGAQPELEQKSMPLSEPPTTLNADFSGIDRLALDATPLSQSSMRLPRSASSRERAAVPPMPESPANDRLKNLPRMSLGNSGVIPTQQAAFDQKMPFGTEADEQVSGTKKVSNTGSFAPLGATGIMKPVGEELLRYHENEQDIYIDDAEEFDSPNGKRSSGDHERSPNMMEIPKSRTKSFFGNLGDRLTGSRNRAEDLDTSPASWLGVDEDFNARAEGSQIGGWDNFSEEDDEGWKGGAYGGESYEEDAQALSHFSSLLVDKEVWIVAVGSNENKNAGIKNLLAEYERDLKSALVINIDGVGIGDLCYTTAEGNFRPKGTDHRLQGLIKSASNALGVDMAPARFKGYNTDASEALASGSRAISILGLDGKLPAGWRSSDDRLVALSEDNLQAVADVVVEVIKSV